VPILVPPTEALRASYLRAMAEFHAEGRGTEDDASMIGHDSRRYAATWHTPAGFADYVAALRADADPDHPRPAGWVACDTWWWADGTEFLGRIAVRHELTERLRTIGGHIGYDVRPTARRLGHGTSMLRAVLPRARSLGIAPSALITCDSGNPGSRKVIEANGGVLADERDGLRRYLVPTDGVPIG
jgi:predicted acetyltransferase